MEQPKLENIRTKGQREFFLRRKEELEQWINQKKKEGKGDLTAPFEAELARIQERLGKEKKEK